MPDPIVLPAHLSSSSLDDLVRRLAECRSPSPRIDGREVRTLGARAAEILVRFRAKIEADGGTLTLDPSAELLDDLRMLGLHDRLTEKELAK